MGTGGYILQFSFRYLSDLGRYYRYSDHAVVSARLVEIGGRKLMRIKPERLEEALACSECKSVLSVLVDKNVAFYLEVDDFHKRHRPIKEEKKGSGDANDSG